MDNLSPPLDERKLVELKALVDHFSLHNKVSGDKRKKETYVNAILNGAERAGPSATQIVGDKLCDIMKQHGDDANRFLVTAKQCKDLARLKESSIECSVGSNLEFLERFTRGAAIDHPRAVSTLFDCLGADKERVKEEQNARAKAVVKAAIKRRKLHERRVQRGARSRQTAADHSTIVTLDGHGRMVYMLLLHLFLEGEELESWRIVVCDQDKYAHEWHKATLPYADECALFGSIYDAELPRVALIYLNFCSVPAEDRQRLLDFLAKRKYRVWVSLSIMRTAGVQVVDGEVTVAAGASLKLATDGLSHCGLIKAMLDNGMTSAYVRSGKFATFAARA